MYRQLSAGFRVIDDHEFTGSDMPDMIPAVSSIFDGPLRQLMLI